MTEDGIDLNELEESLKNNDIKFGYLIPSYHNPTGIVTSFKLGLPSASQYYTSPN